MPETLRSIPAVDKVLQALGSTSLPRVVVTALVRRELAALRQSKTIPPFEIVVAQICASLDRFAHSRLQPVINATGIVIHTNLGRAPLGREVIQTLTTLAGSYNNLEFDLDQGGRGGRASYLEHNLALLCQTPAATVVNNCAAALVLVLRQFTRKKRQVIISRGELVQIGGGFRVPEILEASSALLREVGTTNKTSLSDYESAIGPETGLILKVHRSNFFMDGFVESPSTEELASLARRHRLPLVEDLGSGAIIQTESVSGLEHEPTPAEVFRRGVAVLTCSGDKLFGGPQAGLIFGESRHIQALKKDPFFRAVRCDKLILGALQATVDAYLHGTAPTSLPILAMLHLPEEELRERASRVVTAVSELPLDCKVGHGTGEVGAGALPRSKLRSVTVDLLPKRTELAEFAARLRLGRPPVVGYIAHGWLKLDLRTVFPSQDSELLQAIRAAAKDAFPS